MRQLIFTIFFAICNANSIKEVLINNFSEAGLPLSETCSPQFEEFLNNLEEFDTDFWAWQMLDATSKIPTGIMSLNFGEMGEFEQCVNIRTTNTTVGPILGKYCLGYVSINALPPSNQTDNSKFKKALDGTLRLENQVLQSGPLPGPVWSICIPNGCSSEDANIIGNYIFSALTENLISVSFSDLLCQTIDDVNEDLSTGAIITICILTLLLLMAIVATLYDLYCIFHKKTCPILIKGFSVYSNGQKIFRMTAPGVDQLPCLDGLKFISMIWVVSGHQYSVSMVASIVNISDVLKWAESLHSMFLLSGTLSVDTFLTIGGALMSYGYLKAKSKHVKFNLFMYYFHRYLRLTAPFAVVVLVSSTLLKYMGSGPKWPMLDLYFQQNCVDYWWSALLYVQNYVNVSKMCVGQTWYLSIDMQLYIISPLIFYVLLKFPKICIMCLVLCILGIIGGSFYVAWSLNLTALLSNLYGNSDNYQNNYYLLTHTRAAPWLIGVILGYYIFKIKQKEMTINFHKLTAVALWGVCIAILLVCVLGGHSTLRSSDYDQWGNSFYIALVRPVWSLSITWVVLACSTGYGGPINWVLSLPIYQVLNRFTYSVYLTHVTMLYLIAFNQKRGITFSDFNMMYQFWGTLWFSFGLSILLVFTTESPILTIEKVLFGSSSKHKQQPKGNDVEIGAKGIDNASFEQ